MKNTLKGITLSGQQINFQGTESEVANFAVSLEWYSLTINGNTQVSI